MRTRLYVITDGPWAGTGFGEEMKNLAYRLAQSGRYDVIWQSLQHLGRPVDIPDVVFPDLPQKGATVKILGNLGLPNEFGSYIFPKHYEKYSPDLVMFMGDPRNIKTWIELKKKMGFAFIFYVTLDGLPIPPHWNKTLAGVNMLIAMTGWAQMEWMKTGLGAAYIYHGINWNYWDTNNNDKLKLRKKYGINDDTVVYISRDVVQHRKRQDVLLKCWKAFQPESKNAKLLLWTDWNNPLGINIENKIAQYKVPRNTILGPEDLTGYPKFFGCPNTVEEELMMAKLGDVYLSATSGEGFGKCLHPDTPIITNIGVRKIKNIGVGEAVLSKNGYFTRVLSKKTKKFDGNLVKIKPYGNKEISVTPNHKILGFKRPKKSKSGIQWGNQEPVWIEADKLRKGDVVVFPLYKNNWVKNVIFDLRYFDSGLEYDKNKVWYKMGYSGKTNELIKVNRFIQLDESLAKLFGIYVAEGSEKEISIGKDLSIMSELRNIYLKKFGVEPKIYERGENYRFCITERIIQRFLGILCGIGSHNKRIPYDVIYNKNEKILKTFLRFYWYGDGEKAKFLSGFTTVSLDLVAGLKLAFSRLSECVMLREDKSNKCYRVNSRNEKITHSNKSWINKYGFLAYLIKRVEKIYYNGNVVDIQTVSGDFSTLSFVVHNCLLEAISLKQPVIATKCSSIPEVVGKGGILIPPYEGESGKYAISDNARSVDCVAVNQEKFVEAMLRLYQDAKERKELGILGREHAKQFDYDTGIIPAWLKILGSINPDEILIKETLQI